MSFLFTADELSHAVGGAMTRPFHATGVSIDTRSLRPGDLFVALKTASGDGHVHVDEARAKGASGALVHNQHNMPDDAKLLVVGDTLAGLTALGAFSRQRFEGAVVAITGSVGKTTTKEMLRTALSACGTTHAAHASYNNHWGVPLTLARMPADADYAIIEIGMNHPGEIAPLSRLAGPNVAVITSVESAHIGHLGSMDAIADEKASILEGVLQGGAAVLPADNVRVSRLAANVPRGIRLFYFGRDQILELIEDEDGSDVTADIAGAVVRFRVAAPGRHMVFNALAALTAVAALRADIRVAADALSGFSAIAGRGVRRPLLGGAAMLVDESYNASAASVRAALSVLGMQKVRRRLAVLGDMRELGEFSAAEHAGLANAVSESADMLYACGPWMKHLFDAIPLQHRGAHTDDSAALAPIVAGAVRAGDAVLVKGSLGSRMRVIVDALEALG
jgi:UDP-N-acetylmuramoyl-tripeptide--D-alanyl-D-alanine ligase